MASSYSWRAQMFHWSNNAHGYYKLDRMRDYWNTNDFYDIRFLGNIMSLDRFLFVLRCIHFCDNTDPSFFKSSKSQIFVSTASTTAWVGFIILAKSYCWMREWSLGGGHLCSIWKETNTRVWNKNLCSLWAKRSQHKLYYIIIIIFWQTRWINCLHKVIQ